ncbi:MAG: carbohydrate porin [Cyclobacteriaceae bacterium]
MIKILPTICLLSILSTGFGQTPFIKDSTINVNSNFHFQLTSVTQYKFRLPETYAGTNSLIPVDESASTLTATIFWGTKLWKGAAVYINPEVAGGGGISSARGMAAFTNGEAFRVGDPEPKIYAARAFIKQIFNLGGELNYIGEGANEVYKTRSQKYVMAVAGKFSIADFFDNNSYSHDPRSQFFNWGLMSNGAWDYPANVRGYTWGVMLEYGSEKFKIRGATTLVPKDANGNDMDLNINKANSSVLEFEKPIQLFQRKGIVRLLGFYTQAHMGNYNQAIAENITSPSLTTGPDITNTRSYGRNKYGLGINVEQELGKGIGIFARASWNDGKNETWAFTEIDRSISAGLSFKGERWKRDDDAFGVGSVVSGLSLEHRNYLAKGGYGFIIGDGALNYGAEWVTEFYYKAKLFSDTFYLTANYQFVVNPAYNIDRGPAHVIGLRAHVEF